MRSRVPAQWTQCELRAVSDLDTEKGGLESHVTQTCLFCAEEKEVDRRGFLRNVLLKVRFEGSVPGGHTSE